MQNTSAGSGSAVLERPALARRPAVLIEKLETTRRGMRGYQRTRCLLQVILVGLALLGLLAAADWLWPLPQAVRAAGLFAVAGVAGILLFRGLVLPIHRFGKQEAAVEVEATFPELGQSVRTTLEYVEPKPDTAPALPALVDALTTDTDQRTRSLPIEGLVPWKSLTWVAAGLAGLVVLFTVALVRDPEWRIAALRSLLLPAEYTQLTVKPGDQTLKVGQDFTLEATLTGRPVHDATFLYRPRGREGDWTRVSLAPEAAAEKTAPKLLGNLSTTLKNCRQDLDYRVDAGPVASPTFHLTIQYPLVLKKTEATIEPPQYTRRPTSKVPQANFSVIAGSKVGFRFTLDREAQTARLNVRQKDAKPGENLPPLQLRVEGADLVGELAAVQKELEYEILAEAADGMKLEAGKFRIQVQPDRKPTVKFLKPKDQIEVTPSTEVHMKFEAEDDFGLAKVGIVFQVGNSEKKTLYLKQDPAQPTRYQGEAVLPLEEHKVDFQEGVTYYAFAEDNHPTTPQRATTDLQFIDVRPYKREFQQVEGGGT